MTRPSDRVALFALAALTAAAVVSVAVRWGARAEFADRFLILLGAGWAALRAWPTAPSRPSVWSASPGLPLVVVAAVAFPLAWLVQVQAGPRTVLLWWQAVAASAAAAGALLVRHGWPKVRGCAFALLFPLLALPIPARVLVPLQHNLQIVTTALSGWLLALPYPVSKSGFVLALPGGPLEVAEACSGVRSLTALVAIAAFVAFLRGFGPFGGGLLVLLSIPVVAATNVLRVTLSGMIQETFGTAYIQGTWHEALGFVMVLVGLAGILGLASALGRLATPWESVSVGAGSVSDGVGIGTVAHASGSGKTVAHASGSDQKNLNWLVALLLVLSAVGTAYAVRLGWVALGESLAKVPLDGIPMRLGPWQSKRDEPIPEHVTEILLQDVALYRVYSDNLGREVHCWLMYWSSLSAVQGYHHPDVCWGNRGGVPTYRGGVTVEPTGGGKLPLTARKFDITNGQHFILYWTQDGRRVWDEGAEADAAGHGARRSESGTAWVADLLRPPAARPPGRLTVVLVSRHVGPSAEKEMSDLARRLADEVYAVCPWAAPPE